MKNGTSVKSYMRILCAVLAIVLTAGLLPVQAAVLGGATMDGILYNGSFDLSKLSTQTAPGWGLNQNSVNHTVTIQDEVVYGNTGYALKIEATGQSYIYSADFSVEAGASYLLSYQIRVDEAQNLKYAAFLNDSSHSGGWWQDYATQPVSEVTDGWQEVHSVVTIPESVGSNANNPDSEIQLGFKVYAGSGTFYLDQISFVKTDIHKDDPNQDFEILSTLSGTPANWLTSAAGVEIASDSGVYHAGSRSMHIQKTSLAEKSVVESSVHLPVTTGNIYEFAFWMCSKNADPTVTVRLDLIPYGEDGLQVLAADGSKATVQGTVSALNGGGERSGWEKIVTRAAVPEGTAYVSFRFVLTRGAAQVWIDDIFFQIVEDGTDCVVYYEDFHAVDESGNISTWQATGGEFTAENGGKLTLTAGEGYVFDTLECLATDYTYCLKGHYTANMGGTVQVRFYDYKHREYEAMRQTAALQPGGTEFILSFTAPSHTFAQIYIGSDQTGSITVADLTVYMTAQPLTPNRNYLDADWTARANRENVESRVEVYNGIPTLMIDGQPTAAHLYLRPDLEAYLQTDAESRIVNSGLELYVTYGGNLYKGGCAPIWLPDGTIDYAAFDRVIYDTLAASPDALVMVNIGMFAPQWWLAQNPDHQAQAHNGSSYIPLGDVSLASEKFRQEAGQVLRQLIGHMKEQNYYNRVFGLKISGGQSYEWMQLGTGSSQGPDYSAVSQEGFRTYLKNKYGTDAALQAAWGSDQVTLETAAAPGWDERCASSNVYMGSAAFGRLSRNMVDWNLWLNEASADSFLYYCQIAKEETDGKIIVGGYNGYLWTSNSYDAQGMAHTAMDRVLDSPYVDWISSPIAYNERLLGQSSTYMPLLDSVQAHGKLYIAEQDNRTCLSDSYAADSWDAGWDYSVGQTRTMADTLYQQKRDFANALTNGAGLWQFDMYGGWLDDPQIYDYLRDAKAEYDVSVHLDRDTTNEVAVFVGDETYAYLTAENSNMSFTLLEPMLMQQRKHLAAMGAGYDTYAMSTLLEGKVPGHKLNIVLSPFEITPQMQSAIDAHLKVNGQVVVWVYLPGISTGTELSVANVERTTGFSVGVVEKKSTLRVSLADSGHSLTEGLSGLTYGSSVENAVSPLPYVQSTADATVLGYHTDGGQAALAVKDMGNWTSVYSAAPCLDVQLLRKLMEFVGCHSYSDNPADIIYSSKHYVSLHSAAAGEKTVHLPGNYSVYDVFEGKFLCMNTNQFTYFHRANDTHIFRLMAPDTYAVTASMEGGKGVLSCPGLTQVPAGQSYRLAVVPESGYTVARVCVNGKEAQLNAFGELCIDGVYENTAIEVKLTKTEYLDNSGFEMGSFGGSMTGSTAASVIHDDTVHSGMYSLRLNHDGTARDLVEITVRVNPADYDRTLQVSYWAKTAPGATRALHNGAHFFKSDWTSTQKSVYSAVYPSRTQWQQFTQELTLPAGTEIFQYQLYTDSNKADVSIDDIAFLLSGQNLLPGGNFERGSLPESFTETENTPEIVKAQLVHSGSYAGRLTSGSTVTASAENLNLQEQTQLQLSFWAYVPANASTAQLSYSITGGQMAEVSGTVSVAADGLWHQQTLSVSVPADIGDLQLQLTAKNTCYVDDFAICVIPVQSLDMRFLEIYSDGTWRFAVEEISLLTGDYYKIPALLDGADGYVIAHKVSGMLCIYPSFFTVYGAQIPTTSFVIPAGAMIRAVDPALQWGEVADAQPLKLKQKVEVFLTEAHVKGWNLALGGDLTVNFWVQLPQSIASQAQVVISTPEKTCTYEVCQDHYYDEKEQAYRFSVPIAAAQMTDEICVQTVYDGKTLSEERYTVRQYGLSVLADPTMASCHALVKEMLSYGSASQLYFDYQTHRLAGEGITGTAAAEIPEAAENALSVTGKLPGASFYGASLLFQNKVALRYYFTLSGSQEDYTFAVNGVLCEPVQSGELWYVQTPGVNPQSWHEAVTVTVRDGQGNTLQISYSPMQYIIRMNQKETEKLPALLRAMYNYHLAAKEYGA